MPTINTNTSAAVKITYSTPANGGSWTANEDDAVNNYDSTTGLDDWILVLNSFIDGSSLAGILLGDNDDRFVVTDDDSADGHTTYVSANVNLGDGDDVFIADGSGGDAVEIRNDVRGGNGDDTFTLNNVEFSGDVLAGQGGNDSFVIDNSNITLVATGAGADNVEISNATVESLILDDLSVSGQPNDDTVVISDSNISYLQSDEGLDDITLNNVTSEYTDGYHYPGVGNSSGEIRGSADGVSLDINDSTIGVRIRTFQGDDTISIDNTSVGLDTTMEGYDSEHTEGLTSGEGDDTVSITNGSYIVGNVSTGDETGVNTDLQDNDIVTVSDSTITGNLSTGIANESNAASYSDEDVIAVTNSTIGGGVFAGRGDDEITITNSDLGNTVSGGDGDDLININGGSTITAIGGGFGNDEINISGAGTTVSIIASSGDGDDVMTISDGATVDNVRTGGGDDQLYLSGEDTNITGEIFGGSGSDTIVIDETFSDGDFTINGIDDEDDSDHDVLDISALYELYGKGNVTYDNMADKNDPNTTEEELESGVITYTDGDGVTHTINYTNIEQVICFTTGTQIATYMGNVAAEKLEIGDRVLTADNGYQTIRWIGRRAVTAQDIMLNPKLAPIRIGAGSLGNNLPERDLIVSPQHRMVVSGKIARRMFDRNEVLVTALNLLGLHGIEIAHDLVKFDYIHFLCSQHEVVYAEGAKSETLYTGPEALKSLQPEARQEIVAIFPELADLEIDMLPTPARPLICNKEARALLSRHIKNGLPII